MQNADAVLDDSLKATSGEPVSLQVAEDGMLDTRWAAAPSPEQWIWVDLHLAELPFCDRVVGLG